MKITKTTYYIVLRRFYYKTLERAKEKKIIDSHYHTGFVKKSPSGWSYVRIQEV